MAGERGRQGEESVVTWLATYVIIGCLIGIVSLSYTEPEELSPLLFVTAHVLWPISLVLILAHAIFSPQPDKSN
jgi:hypothetical protein